MMLFRIEDISGFGDNPREYNTEEQTPICVNKAEIDNFIAQKIREEINNSKNRELLSYSKSLATCILKYNTFADNELHIYIPRCIDYICYISNKNNIKYKPYSIGNRITGEKKPLFNRNGTIKLRNFVIDISNNTEIDEYLKIYTDTGKKAYASPEKDHEVVVMNPDGDLVINQYLSSVYILYALQLRYHFLNNYTLTSKLIGSLYTMEDFFFTPCPRERRALISLVEYLSQKWDYEYQISKGTYNYEKDDRIHTYYDPICQFQDIVKSDNFESSYNLRTYNDNVISSLFWEYCRIFLGQ